MSGTVENLKLAELTTDELGAGDLDVVSAGGVSMSCKEVEFRYTPQEPDRAPTTK